MSEGLLEDFERFFVGLSPTHWPDRQFDQRGFGFGHLFCDGRPQPLRREQCGITRGNAADGQTKSARNFYASEIDAIATAKQRWLELRATKFTPAAIAAALIPRGSPQKHTTQFSSDAGAVARQ
jgi:hypothetical protein